MIYDSILFPLKHYSLSLIFWLIAILHEANKQGWQHLYVAKPFQKTENKGIVNKKITKPFSNIYFIYSVAWPIWQTDGKKFRE